MEHESIPWLIIACIFRLREHDINSDPLICWPAARAKCHSFYLGSGSMYAEALAGSVFMRGHNQFSLRPWLTDTYEVVCYSQLRMRPYAIISYV